MRPVCVAVLVLLSGSADAADPSIWCWPPLEYKDAQECISWTDHDEHRFEFRNVCGKRIEFGYCFVGHYNENLRCDDPADPFPMSGVSMLPGTAFPFTKFDYEGLWWAWTCE